MDWNDTYHDFAQHPSMHSQSSLNAYHASYYDSYGLPHNMPQDRKSTRLNSSHSGESRMPSSA